MRKLLTALLVLGISGQAHAGITEGQYHQILDMIEAYYSPLAEQHGARLNIMREWENDTVDSSAGQRGNEWRIQFFGGLARHRDMTYDAYSLIACHEFGHHFGGYPNYSWGLTNEGQADYFASLSCIKQFWIFDTDRNAQSRDFALPTVIAKCDAAHATVPEQTLCYRVLIAAQELTTVLADMQGDAPPTVETYDPSTASETIDGHATAQCRLDTYVAGALCQKGFDSSVIPDQNNQQNFNCSASLGDFYPRPTCWYVDPAL